MASRLDNKTIIISGSGTGMGLAAAKLFCSEGARVIIAEISEESGRAAQDSIVAAGGKATFVRTDVTSDESVKACVAACIRHYGRVDVLYNNAGGSTRQDGPITECSMEEFRRAIDYNLLGPWLFCRYGIPEMIKTGGGSIINVSSTAALRGLKGIDAYTAAKGGVTALTRSLAVEYAQHNIRVNAIAPSTTMTERVIKFRADNHAPTSNSRNVLGPLDPIDIARFALYLASDDSRKTTGQIIPIDSGYTIS